jgi:hypothetical protein
MRIQPIKQRTATALRWWPVIGFAIIAALVGHDTLMTSAAAHGSSPHTNHHTDHHEIQHPASHRHSTVVVIEASVSSMDLDGCSIRRQAVIGDSGKSIRLLPPHCAGVAVDEPPLEAIQPVFDHFSGQPLVAMEKRRALLQVYLI